MFLMAGTMIATWMKSAADSSFCIDIVLTNNSYFKKEENKSLPVTFYK
jgi:hypothetical protein